MIHGTQSVARTRIVRSSSPRSLLLRPSTSMRDSAPESPCITNVRWPAETSRALDRGILPARGHSAVGGGFEDMEVFPLSVPALEINVRSSHALHTSTKK